MQLGGPHDEVADPGGGDADVGRAEDGEQGADDDGHNGRNQDINRRFLADGLAAFRGYAGNDQNGQRAARAAQLIGGEAHGAERKQHKRRTMKRVSDGDRHGDAGDRFGKVADLHQQIPAELTAEGSEDGADEKGREEPLRHRTQRVDAVALGRKDDVLSLEKFFYRRHDITQFQIFPYCNTFCFSPQFPI